METATGLKSSSLARVIMRLATVVAVMMGMAAVAAPPASAGSNGCVWINARNGEVKVQHVSRCGLNGTYHMDVWGGGYHTTTGDYTYVGVLKEKTVVNVPVPGGTKMCAELWFHKPSGGYESMGLPCDDM